jgi:hypothetical protein
MNPCVLGTHGAMVAPAILSPVFFPVRTTHRQAQVEEAAGIELE